MPERYCVIYKTANVSDFEFLGTSSVNLKKGESGTVPYSLITLNMDESLKQQVEAIHPSTTIIQHLHGYYASSWISAAQDNGFTIIPPVNEGSP
tara:strand:+ start:1100 stop:1381 length:282 start_codon:yes stop_codon:yes gene_type:complete